MTTQVEDVAKRKTSSRAFHTNTSLEALLEFSRATKVILMLLESDKRAGCYPEQCDDAVPLSVHCSVLPRGTLAMDETRIRAQGRHRQGVQEKIAEDAEKGLR